MEMQVNILISVNDALCIQNNICSRIPFGQDYRYFFLQSIDNKVPLRLKIIIAIELKGELHFFFLLTVC